MTNSQSRGSCSKQAVDGKHDPGEASRNPEDSQLRFPNGEKHRVKPKGSKPQPIDEKTTQCGEGNDHRDEYHEERQESGLSHGNATPRPDRESLPTPGFG